MTARAEEAGRAQEATREAEGSVVQVEGALSRLLSRRLALTWEGAIYGALFVTGFGFRFWDLGSRAMHHDESLHAYYAWQLFQGNGYEHTPLLHGPFQFFGTALAFFLTGGPSDWSARALPALFGGVLVGLPFLLRGQLGRWGAITTAALIALSPTLLYYSRFARNDIYVAVFTLGLVVCLWRYVAERRPRYVAIAGGLLGLSFATKETAFVTAGILLVFLNLWVAADLARQTRERLRPSGWRLAALYGVVYLPLSWAITAAWPMMGRLRKGLGIEERPAAMDFFLVVGTLAAPQFAAAAKLPFEAAGVGMDSAAAERLLGFPTVVGLIVAAAAAGLTWNWRLWLLCAAAFYVPYTLLYTALFTDVPGFASGIWGSLDYWLGQHGARRGDQPDFYYLMFFPTYEFVALALAGPALLFYTLRGGPRSWALTLFAVVALLAVFGLDSFEVPAAGAAVALLPAAAVSLYFAVSGSMFERFLTFWFGAAVVAYSYVGEKMPWLSVHTTLPLVVLAGYVAGRLLPSMGAQLQFAGGTWLRRLRPIALVRSLLVVAAAAAFAGLSVLSVRTAVEATYARGDVPREFLFYTQTSADVPRLADEIQRLAETTGLGRQLRIHVDKAYTWPWAWYLRDYDVSFDTINSEFRPERGAVVILAAPNEIFASNFRDGYQPSQPFTLRAWFPEDYRGIGDKPNLAAALTDFLGDLRYPSTWSRWWEYLVRRDVTPRGIEGRVYYPRDLTPGAAVAPGPDREGTAGPEAPVPDLEGRYIIGRPGSEQGELLGPVGLALDGDGNPYVADSGNHRVQKFSARGWPAGVVGGLGTDPGRFNQPADLAVDVDGFVYVVDTWNHRVQKLAPNLSPVLSWGKPTVDLLYPGPDEFWGPRGIAVDDEGNIWITDTGTHRVRRFAPDGTPLGAFGRRGKEPGQFIEPVGIDIGPDGAVYVADAGNARIQKFDKEFKLLAVFPIPSWEDRDPRNKPYLEVLPDGRILATDAPHGRILLIRPDGIVEDHIDTVAEVPLYSPSGVAFDPERGFVYVSDEAAANVRRFPLTDFALR
jgi:uncharacterized protein (TIGR03663 family)